MTPNRSDDSLSFGHLPVLQGVTPQCGEMSHRDRGDRLRQRKPFSKGFPSIATTYCCVGITPKPQFFILQQVSPAFCRRRQGG